MGVPKNSFSAMCYRELWDKTKSTSGRSWYKGPDGHFIMYMSQCKAWRLHSTKLQYATFYGSLRRRVQRLCASREGVELLWQFHPLRWNFQSPHIDVLHLKASKISFV